MEPKIKALANLITNGETQDWHTPEQKQIWNLITGLRGPDVQSGTIVCECASRVCPRMLNVKMLKDATTSVIRHALLMASDHAPTILESGHKASAGYDYNADCEKFAQYRRDLYHVMGWSNDPSIKPFEHFINHASLAFRALGLQWTKVNTAKETI